MFSLGPQAGLNALIAGGGMKDIYFKFAQMTTDKLGKIAGSYGGVRGGLGLVVGCQGRAMINRHNVIIYGSDYVYNPFNSLRIDSEGATLTASTFKIEFRSLTAEEQTDPLVKSFKSKPNAVPPA
jgi:hypothetical protein